MGCDKVVALGGWEFNSEEQRKQILLLLSSVGAQATVALFDELKEVLRHEKRKQRLNQFYVSFFAKEFGEKIVPPKFQLKAEKSEVLELIVTELWYIINLMTKQMQTITWN